MPKRIKCGACGKETQTKALTYGGSTGHPLCPECNPNGLELSESAQKKYARYHGDVVLREGRVLWL